jgi:acyl-CoA synthetase (AMP-forming)/AMP-acid ligase II
MDDCFKTAGGYLVSSAFVANALRSHPQVLDAVAVPVRRRGAAGVGVLVAASGAIGSDEIHALARRTLPPWLQPAVVAVRAGFPALITGKHDREACIRLLEAELGAARDAP